MTLAPVIPREPVTPASLSLFVGTLDDDASIYIDDDLPVDASSPTAGDSIILDNDNSKSPLDDFTGDGMNVGSKSVLTRLEEMFPHMTSQQLADSYNLSGSSLSI